MARTRTDTYKHTISGLISKRGEMLEELAVIRERNQRPLRRRRWLRCEGAIAALHDLNAGVWTFNDFNDDVGHR
jgi:hypothetical protein